MTTPTAPTALQVALIPSDAAVIARAIETGKVIYTPPPVPAGPTVTGLTVKGADVNNSVSVSLTLNTPGTIVTKDFAVAVRKKVNPVDNGDLDFPHVTAVTLHGSQTWGMARSYTDAGDYIAYPAYTEDGITWTHLDKNAVTFTITTPVTPPPVNPTPTTNPLGTTGARSGLPWNSGIWPPVRDGNQAGNFASTLAYQESRRGFKSDTDMFAQWAAQWSDLVGAQDGKSGLDALKWLLAGSSAVPIVMLPPFPAGGTWTDAAAGKYDNYYKLMGQTIAFLAGNRKVVIRFAWECNGNWYPWSIISAGGVTAFKAGWVKAVGGMRTGAGTAAKNIVFVYSLSGLDDKGQGDPLTNCPDMNYWDVLGIDAYDDYQVTTSATVPGKIDILNRAAAFCRTNKKWISLDEWGLDHSSNHPGGGDNINYISAMYTWMKANRDILAWESYFQDDALDNVNSSLFSPNVDNNPKSRVEYTFLQKAALIPA